MDGDAEGHPVSPSLGVPDRHVDDRPASLGPPGQGDLGDSCVKAATEMALRMVDVTDDKARRVRAWVGTASAPGHKESENYGSSKSAALRHLSHGTSSSQGRIRTL